MRTKSPLKLPAGRAASRTLQILLAGLPAAMLVLWAGWTEFDQFKDARDQIGREARVVAGFYAARIAGHLDTQFTELQFAAVALLGPEANPSAPDPHVVETIRRFMGLHPGLYAFNIQSADGNTILWSTRGQNSRPITPGSAFTPLEGNPNLFLGRHVYAKRAGGDVLTMRFRVQDEQGRTRYFVGTPYRVRDLLSLQPLGGNAARWSFRVIDRRDGDQMGSTAAPGSRRAGSVRTQIPGYPLDVDVAWSGFAERQEYMRAAPMRWMFELSAFALLLSAAWGILRLIGQRDRQAEQRQRLSQFNALLVQVHQRMAPAQDPQRLLQEICDLTVRETGASLVCVARPDEHGQLHFGPMSGCTGYLEGLEVRVDADSALGQGGMGRSWREQRPVFLASFDAPGLEPWRERAERFGVRATAVLPILRQGRLWGLLAAYHPMANVYDHELQEVLRVLALDVSRGLDRIDAQNLQRALLDNSVVGIAVIGQRVIRQCNQRLATLVGRSVDELLGQPTRFLYADEANYARVTQAYDAMRSSGMVSVPNVSLSQRGAGQIMCDLTGVALADGEDGLSVWTVEDVTQRERHAQQLHRLAQFNAWLAHVNRAAGTIEHGRTLYEEVCRAAVDVAGMRLAWVGRPDPSGGEFEVLAAAGATEYLGQARISADEASPGGRGPTGEAWRQGRPVFVPSYQTPDLQSPWVELGRRHDFGSFAALPIHEHVPDAPAGAAPRVVAVLTVYCAQDDALGDKERDLLAEIAAAVERGLQGLEQRHRIAALQRLYHALLSEGEVLLQGRSEHDMLQQTCDRLVDGTMFHAAWVGQPDASGRLRVLAAAGSGAAQVDALNINVHGCEHPPLAVQAWMRQRLVFSNDSLSDPRSAEWQTFAVANRWRAALAVPLRRGDAVWAVLVFVSPQRDVFEARSIALCRRVGELLGHGLDELDLKQQLHDIQSAEAHRARHDALTGLPNRFALGEYLPLALERAQRRERVLAVGMLDLDDFKPVNDTWGHEAGDLLLRDFGQRLRALLRGVDFVARLGGDEFVVVIEDLEPAQALAQLETALVRLHGAVESPFDVAAGARPAVGMSMGLALFPGDAEDPDSLLRLADAAMYQAKQNKSTRESWWSLGGPVGRPAERGMSLDVYGTQVVEVLERARDHLRGVAAAFADAFYAQLAQEPELQAILATLSPADMVRLRQRQAEHLAFVLDARTDREQLLERARAVGEVHALVGVGNAWLGQGQALYRKLLGEHLNRTDLAARDRYQLMLVAEGRLQDDIQTQQQQAQRVMEAYMRELSRPLPPPGTLWIDAVRDEIESLGKLPGVLDATSCRPDSEGVFQIEAMAGSHTDALRAVLTDPRYRPALNGDTLGSTSLLARAWRQESLVTRASYAAEGDAEAWHRVLAPLGVRSGMAFAVLVDGAGPVAAVRLLGRFPNQFEGPWMRQFAASLQLRWATVWLRCRTPASAAVPREQVLAWRDRLFDHGLRMWAQPIVDLRSGEMVKAEALARLEMPDGDLVSPGQFLPLLGNVELDRLFRLGLDQALQHLQEWDAQGLQIGVSVNIAPGTLLDPLCAQWVEEALTRHGVQAHRLTLELLESPSLSFAAEHRGLNRLRSLGVSLAMDDLGSGYSSLQRLTALPFDTIKVDQSLLHNMRAQPVQTLSLVRTIVQMGRDLERDVVVEGLETPAMIEAARLLGARFGQGYGLARPMPPDQLAAWAAQRRHALPTRIESFLGALAYHWQFMHDGSETHPDGVELCPLHAFLQRQGEAAREAMLWHAQVHAEQGAREASRRLSDWLLAGVADEA